MTPLAFLVVFSEGRGREALSGLLYKGTYAVHGDSILMT